MKPHYDQLPLKSHYTTQALCLKAMNYRESDRLITLYSPEYGPLHVIAKGVKNPKSKLSGVSDPLNWIEVQCVKGKSLDTLVQYQPIYAFPQIRQDLIAMSAAMAGLETVYHLANQDAPETEAIFHHVKNFLETVESLISTPDRQAKILKQTARFHIAILEDLGYQPAFDQCMVCQTGLDLEHLAETGISWTYFSIEYGGMVCPGCAEHHHHKHPTVKIRTKTLQFIQNPHRHPCPVGEDLDHHIRILRFLNLYTSRKLEKTSRAFPFLFDLLTEDSRLNTLTG